MHTRVYPSQLRGVYYIEQCPYCKRVGPWEPQPVDVVVRCPNREITSYVVYTPERQIKQLGTAIYGTTDGAVCWNESYWVDGDDCAPRYRCGREYIVKAVEKEKAGLRV